MRRIGLALALVVVVISLIGLALTTDFLVDWAWFSAVGYVSVYWTILGTKLVLFGLAFVASTAFPVGERIPGLSVRRALEEYASDRCRARIYAGPDAA